MSYKQIDSEQERERGGKVIEGSAKVRKRSKSQKFLDTLVPEDMYDVRSYVIQDVIAPIIQNCLYEIGVGALGSIFGRGKPSSPRSSSRASYRDYYDIRGRREAREIRDYSRSSRYYDEPIRRRTYEYDTICFDTYTEADKVLERMRDQVATYGNVSVLEYFDFAGVSCDYTARDWVMEDLRRAKVVWDRDGWIIEGLPRPVPIK